MRLPYFPQLQPDELLYSLLARHSRHIALAEPGGHMGLLFGRRATIPTIDLPGHLAELAARLDPSLGLDADSLIDRATLFPYYAAYQAGEVRASIRADMREGNASKMHHRSGIVAFRVPRPSMLRFCPDCLSSRLRHGEEAYWHRVHQVPGAVVCPVHGVALRESLVRPSTQPRHGYVPATPDACPDRAPPIVGVAGGIATDALMALALEAASLLSTAGEPRRLAEWGDHYREKLETVGLMRSRHKVDQARLSEALLDHYRDVLAFLPEACGRLGIGGWPEQIVRTHRKAFHPLLHGMLRAFLSQASSGAAPFGHAPWPCLNPLADHRGHLTIGAMDRHRNRDTLVGVFTCRCGYAYTRCLRADGRLDAPRMRAVGPLFEPALRRLLVPGCTLRGVAKALGVDPKTLMREAASAGVPVSWSTAPSGRPRLLADVRDECVPKARSSRCVPVGKARKDWPALDLEVVKRLEAEAQAVLAIVPPVRVTLAELERRVCGRGWLRKRLNKVPLSNAVVNRLAEPASDHRRRRVRFILASHRTEPDLQPWKVMRLGGLGTSDFPMIEEEMRSLRSENL